MRLDFNVLWVDDQPDSIDSQIKRITGQMEAEGFQFKPKICKSMETVRAHIAESVFVDEIDLILVDWDLGSGAHGQDVISAIRESVPYKDVVFYSSLNPAETLRKEAFESGIEGIYCTNREGLVDEVLGVFESLVKKVLDLDHTRGIVMGATSDIDQMVNESLLAMYGKFDDAGKKTMLEGALKRIDDKVKMLTNDAQKLRKNASLQGVLKAHMIFTADHRLRMLSETLENALFGSHSAVRPSVIKYRDEVVPLRNKLGHLVLAPEGKPEAVSAGEGEQVNLEQMRDLRRLILNLRHDFKSPLSRQAGGLH
jgi:hypothetical protein